MQRQKYVTGTTKQLLQIRGLVNCMFLEIFNKKITLNKKYILIKYEVISYARKTSDKSPLLAT